MVSIAIVGRPNSASNPSSLNKTRHARPIISINTINGVCQTKNQIIACLRSLSEPKVITRETTCGCPATPRPPKKNANAHNEIPNFKSGGQILVSVGFWASRPEFNPLNPPT